MKKKLISSFINFRGMFTECKVHIQRSMSYLAILNSGMILFLLLSKLQEYGLNIHITKWFFPIFVVSVLGMIFVGYMDDWLGFHREEHRAVQKRNPMYSDIIERLERIEEKLKK